MGRCSTESGPSATTKDLREMFLVFAKEKSSRKSYLGTLFYIMYLPDELHPWNINSVKEFMKMI